MKHESARSDDPGGFAARAAIHSAIMAALSIPAYGLMFLAIGRMAEEEKMDVLSLGAIGLVLTVFIAWNGFGLVLGIWSIFGTRRLHPLPLTACGMHLLILILILILVLRFSPQGA
ncbi:MAG: hypothetical protein R3236_10875 [Phycisphaeraceae bacterium]|nr:hypothetical protein [Phycisphaeraceae bacterium]